MVEPQPQLAESLRQRRQAKVYAVACSAPEKSGQHMTLYLAGGLSSFDPNLKVATARPEGAIDVPLRTLDEILADAGAPLRSTFSPSTSKATRSRCCAGSNSRAGAQNSC